VSQRGRTNYFVICPDELGLALLLQGALSAVATAEDIYYYNAEGITKEKARQIEVEARFASRAGAELSHFFIYSLQNLPTGSVGPLLKVAEEAKYARFIFQTQSVSRKLFTLMSRSNVVRLPFLSERVVLGNLKAMNYDAKTVETLGLYDGTLSGTIKALGMKDTIIEIRREMKRGLRGLTALFHQEILNSLAYDTATYEFLTPAERRFLKRNSSLERRKIITYLSLQRQGSGMKDGKMNG